MYPIYDKNKGLLIIEWYERKQKKAVPVRHYYEQKPMKIQLHPADPKVLIRVHLPGKMPGWIKDYCNQREHRFEFEEVQLEGEIGWILTNWTYHETEKMPIIAPNLQGALRKLARRIPGVCQELRQQLLDNAGIAARNLKYHPDIFGSVGVYYRPEEILGKEGCLIVDHTVFLEKLKEETDEDYRARLERDGRLFTIVRELTFPLPEPASEETAEEEQDDNTELNDVSLGEIEPEDEPLGEIEPEDELLGEIEPEDEPLGEIVPEDEPLGEIEPEDEPLGESESDHEVPEDFDPVEETQFESEPVSKPMPASISNNKSSPEPEDSCPYQFVILEYSDKKSGVVEGQMSIF